MCELVKGKDLKSVARNMDLRLSTVRTYKNRVFKKMKVRGIKELIYYAVRNDLVV